MAKNESRPGGGSSGSRQQNLDAEYSRKIADVKQTALVDQLEAQLRERWPQAFARYAPRPLRIGTFHIIAEKLGLDRGGRKLLRRVVRRWTNRDGYLAALAAPGAARFDLDGRSIEPVSPEHQADARDRLERRQAERQRAEQRGRPGECRANAARPILRLSGPKLKPPPRPSRDELLAEEARRVRARVGAER